MFRSLRLRPLPLAASFLLVTLAGSLAGAGLQRPECEAPTEPQASNESCSPDAAQQELRPPVTPAAASSPMASIDAAVRRAMREQKIPGLSICVADRNEIIFSRGYGLADVENDVPVTTATVFRTASIAKAMTAVAAMRLAARGTLDLDAPVQTYVPGFPQKQSPVSTRQLLSHLGGVRHYASRSEASATRHFASVGDGLRIFADDPLLHEPGTKYLYSSFGFNLVGAAIEGASNVNFESLLQQEVFTPAGMASTCRDDHFTIIPHRSEGYLRYTDRTAGRFPTGNFKDGELYNASLHDTSSKVPGGGLVSTSDDLVRFLTCLNRGGLLDEPSRAAMWTVQHTQDGKPTGYGLGWRIRERNGLQLVGHGGGQAGTSTYMLLDPKHGIAVAAMCNLELASLEPLATSIVKQLAAIHLDEQKPATTGHVPPRDGYGDIAQALRTFIQPEIAQKKIPALSIALVEEDKIVWSEGFGIARAQPNTPATAETVYRVGSISKLLTDVAVMQAVEDDQLDLDADIKAVLPDFAPQNDSGTPITLRQLMSHRSGLVRESPVGNYFDPTEPSLAATVESLNNTSLVYPPNTKTKYSNAAVSVAGYALEKASGVPFEEHMAAKLLAPLGMSSSSYRRLDPNQFPVAEGWMWGHDGQRFVAPDFALGTLPAGNLYSSVNDLGRFMIAVLNEGQIDGNQVLKADLLKQMLSPTAKDDGSRTFGIGFHLSEFEKEPLFGHAGAVYGFATQFRGLPERKLGVVIVCSLDCANGFESRIADYALRLLKAKQDSKTVDPPPRATDVDSQLARQLRGRYESAGKQIELVEYLGKLYLQTDASLREVRQAEKALVLDDVFGFGPEIKRGGTGEVVYQDKTWKRLPDEVPAEAPERWRGLIGMYGWPHNPLYIFENHGQLWALVEWFEFDPLTEIDENTFAFPDAGMYVGEHFRFERDANGVAQRVIVASVPFERMPMSAPGETFKIKPLKPTKELREIALNATPPVEPGEFREPELVDLTSLDNSIKLDIRYASENNFVGSRFYERPRAFMQRAAAEALLRVHRKAKEHGLGLLIYDAYRPWFVTKMFWEATPAEMKHFVADPSKGSRHNRGCAVDLTFYDLETGQPVETVAGYDEFSTRAYPMSPGGTSRQRYFRTLLRALMEAEGFTIYEYEWWHFDFKDWKQYPILNVPFEKIADWRESARP